MARKSLPGRGAALDVQGRRAESPGVHPSVRQSASCPGGLWVQEVDRGRMMCELSYRQGLAAYSLKTMASNLDSVLRWMEYL